MTKLTILSKVTKDAVATAKFDDTLKSGQVVTYENEDGAKLEGIVSFAKEWETEKYSNLPIARIEK